MFIIVQVHCLMVLFSSVLINYRQYLGIIFLIIIVMLLSLLGEYFRYTTYVYTSYVISGYIYITCHNVPTLIISFFFLNIFLQIYMLWIQISNGRNITPQYIYHLTWSLLNDNVDGVWKWNANKLRSNNLNHILVNAGCSFTRSSWRLIAARDPF